MWNLDEFAYFGVEAGVGFGWVVLLFTASPGPIVLLMELRPYCHKWSVHKP